MKTPQNTKRIIDFENEIPYWKNQTPPEKGQLFTDPLFPPNENALLGKDFLTGNWIDPDDEWSSYIEVERIEWKRAPEIFYEYLLFEESINESDLKQGNIGDGFIISTVASLCKYPNLIYNIFKTKNVNPDGYYELILYLDGMFQIVIVDDLFPVYKGTNKLYFASPTYNNLWGILIEKAWAKVNGGYANIDGGWPNDVWQALTGFATESIRHDEKNLPRLWNIIKHSEKSGSILCSATKEDLKLFDYGLVPNHSYTLIGAQTVKYKGMDVRLVRMRNPWGGGGHLEWKGDWSDKSPLWTEEAKENIAFCDQDDGIFWMSVKDLEPYFQNTNICHIMHDCYFKHYLLRGEDVKIPHVFNIYLENQMQVSFSIIKKNLHYKREFTNPTRLIIGKYIPNTRQIEKLEGSFEVRNNCQITRIFESGYYVAWTYIADNYCTGLKPDSYFFQVASPSNFHLKHQNTDSNFEFLRELIAGGIRDAHPEILKKKHDCTYLLEHNFQQTGLGFRYIYNPCPTKYQIWSNNADDLVNMQLLPPFEYYNDFEFSIPPRGEAICLGMILNKWKPNWFNLKSSYKSFKCINGEDPTNTKKIQFEDYCSEDVLNTEITYDYISMSSEELNKSLLFPKVNMLEYLKKVNPNIIDKIMEFPPIFDETTLRWKMAVENDGFYLGQYSDEFPRHGRGAYYSKKDETTWVGYWKMNKKYRYGKSFNKLFELTFEGEYQNGMKNGNGTWYFSHGDSYVGTFIDNYMNGNGSYKWQNGSKWEGTFLNNQKHGKGLYTDEKGKAYSVEYHNDEIVE